MGLRSPGRTYVEGPLSLYTGTWERPMSCIGGGGGGEVVVFGNGLGLQTHTVQKQTVIN